MVSRNQIYVLLVESSFAGMLDLVTNIPSAYVWGALMVIGVSGLLWENRAKLPILSRVAPGKKPNVDSYLKGEAELKIRSERHGVEITTPGRAYAAWRRMERAAGRFKREKEQIDWEHGDG